MLSIDLPVDQGVLPPSIESIPILSHFLTVLASTCIKINYSRNNIRILRILYTCQSPEAAAPVGVVAKKATHSTPVETLLGDDDGVGYTLTECAGYYDDVVLAVELWEAVQVLLLLSSYRLLSNQAGSIVLVVAAGVQQ
jgi:hypothetical protein